MRTGVKVALAVVILIVIGIGITLLSGGLTILLAPFQGEVEKSQQVEGSGEYRVAQHDYFYNLCSDIQAKQQNIALLEESAKTASGEEKQKIQDSITANKFQLNEMVSQYNADASNDYTKGQFKDDELPYQINAEEEVTSCGKP